MHRLAPEYLELTEYGSVADLMLTEQVPSAYSKTGLVTIQKGKHLGFIGVRDKIDKSFSAQIRHVRHRYDSLGQNFNSPPDIYLLTANSAIPIADAIRGHFDEAGIAQPEIDLIEANHYVAGRFFNRTDWGKIQASNEMRRLEERLEGAEHVCVIDQYVSSGNTLSYAGEVLRAAGIVNVSAIRGQWYHDAFKDQVDPQSMTSFHSDFMRKVGQASCAELTTF